MKKNGPKLLIDWASYDAAKYAVMNWHYSKTMPAGKLVKFGVWENDTFIGCVIYGLGSNYNLSKIVGMKGNQVCELVRVALTGHVTPVTRIISITLKKLAMFVPGIEAVISYADKDQGHEGIIYKAGNWQRIGGLVTDEHYLLFGKRIHPRTCVARYGTRSIPWIKKNIDKNVEKIKTKGKIRYIYPLSKRAKHRVDVLLSSNSRKGGSNPTRTLQKTTAIQNRQEGSDAKKATGTKTKGTDLS